MRLLLFLVLLLPIELSAQRPNIIYIMTDDMGYGDLSSYGRKEYATPNLDKLASQGMKFVNAYSAGPLCTPTRVGFMTGQYPARTPVGLMEPLTDSKASINYGLTNEFPSMSSLVRNAGYHTALIGKWHLGIKPEHSPTKNGFDYFFGFHSGASDYISHKSDARKHDLWENDSMVYPQGYLTDLISEKAISYIRTKHEKPFFLVVNLKPLQAPYDGVPQKYQEPYAQAKFDTFHPELAAATAVQAKEMLADPVAGLRKAAAAISALDDEVRIIVAKILERKLLDGTWILFNSTSGDLLSHHGLWGAGDASEPVNMYEESLRTPMIWVWPGEVPAQLARPELVSAYDLMPTLCEAINIDPPSRNLCGRSYLALATGKPLPKNEPWRATLFANYKNTGMARVQRYKLVLRDSGKGQNELYGLVGDPAEKVNQYAIPEFVTVRNSLTAELNAWKQKFST